MALPQQAARLLRTLRESAADPNGFVFTPAMAALKRPCYPFIDPDYFSASVFAPVAKAGGLGGMRFHDLRHFFASMLIAQGESAKYVCDQMGHSSIQITFDTYGHLFPQARPEAAAKLEQAVFAGRNPFLPKSPTSAAKKQDSAPIPVENVVEIRPFLDKKRSAAGGSK